MIRSFLGTSLIEFPGRISSVVFMGGCNLYCPFCHNPELVRPDILAEQYSMTEDEVMERLREREGFIDGVSITGGEPLCYPRIVNFLGRLKGETGLQVKLDTNGTIPDRLAASIRYVDYVAMDIKSSPGRYEEATGGRAAFDGILTSVSLIREMPSYEFRTTMVPGLVSSDDVREIVERIGRVRRYVLQRFRPGKTLSPEFAGVPSYPGEYLESTSRMIAPLVDEVLIRS